MEPTEPAGANPPQDAPLSGVHVLDLSRLAPGPFCSFLLADLGADVTVVLGPGGGSLPQVSRGKRFVALDLKSSAGRLALQRLAARADVLIEGFRPGVADRLGAGYDTLRVLRPELIYCSITGYGQAGPLARTAGHDINYLAQAGLLGAVGPSGSPPLPPLNLLADFAGGSFLAAIAILAALVERSHSGLGQHLDVAMVDGVQSMMTMHYATWGGPAMPGRGEGLLAGTAPFYRCYECADGRYVAVGALEAPFFAALWRTLGLADLDPVPDHLDPNRWPEQTKRLEAAFIRRSRDEWGEVFEGIDACVSPVLAPDEVHTHPHTVARHGPRELADPPPIPRFSRTPSVAHALTPEDATRSVLASLGMTPEQIEDAAGETPGGTLASWPPIH
jgi:alpha-methylacyl-CoA racemase